MINKAVQLASDFTFIVSLVKTNKKQIQIFQANIVKLYNLLIAGVDLFEMLQSLYLLHHKSKKYYFRIFLDPNWIAIGKKVIISKFQRKLDLIC